MSVEARINLGEIYADETPALSLDHVSNPTLRHIITALAPVTLNASSTPPASQAWSDEIDLAAGAATIDLTALARGDLSAGDWTDLKVQIAVFYADPDNTEPVVIADGAANGYEIFGDANGQVSLEPGDVEIRFCKDTLDDVAAADCEIDLTSVDADAKLHVLLVAG